MHERLKQIIIDEEENAVEKMRQVYDTELDCDHKPEMDKYINCTALMEDIKRPGTSLAVKQQIFSSFQDKFCYNKTDIQTYLEDYEKMG
jgi:hypothetical protein